MICKPSLTRLWHTALRFMAAGTLAVYVVWQILWLSHGRVPPALFLAATGLPAPTTGGTRSLLCLLRGDGWGSLHHNAMTVPIVLLTVVSLGSVVSQLLRRRRVCLPRSVGITWFAVLALAWLIKLVQEAIIKI
jgi:hypothetical protein